MKIEAVGAEYADLAINVHNQEVIFKNNIAEVSEELGKSMITNFPHFFEEGKVILPEEEEDIHVFDQQKYEEQAEKLVKLNIKIKQKEQMIAELTGQVNDWKKLYVEAQEKIKAIGNEQKKEPVQPELELDTEEGYRKRLEAKNIDELKDIAKNLQVPDALVKKKSAKKSWIDAIIEKTFKI